MRRRNSWTLSRGWQVAAACLALRVCGVVGSGLASTALLRLFELNVCRHYYRQHEPGVIAFDGTVPEMKCKIGEVQSDMSNFTSIDGAISLVPTLLGALPYLIWSRSMNKLLLLLIYYIGFLTTMGFNLAILFFYNTFDIRWVYLLNVLTLIGGGEIVFRSLVSSIAAEALPKESLTAYYLYSSAVLLITHVLSTAVGLELMQLNLWLAVLLGVGFHSLSIPILSFLDHDSNEQQEENVDYKHENHDQRLRQVRSRHTTDASAKKQSFWCEALDFRTHGSKLLTTAKHHAFHILIFWTHKCGMSAAVLLPEWLSKRYQKPLREVGFIQLGEQLWTTVLLLLVPRIHRYITRRDVIGTNNGDGIGNIKRNTASLILIQWSVVFSIVGMLLLSVSWSLIVAVISLTVSAAGSGFYDLLLGYVTLGIQRADLAQVYMCISIAEILGGRIAAVSIFGVYSLAVKMESGFVGMGLPLWFCTALFGMTYWLVRLL